MVELSFCAFLVVFDPVDVFHGPSERTRRGGAIGIGIDFCGLASVSVVFGRSSAFQGHHVNELLNTVKIDMAIDFYDSDISFGRQGIIGVRSHPETHFQLQATPRSIEITKSYFPRHGVTFGRTHP